MLASLLVVFREILEAGLIVGIVLAATRGIDGRMKWTAAGIAAGVAGAVIVAAFADALYAAFAGSGQELFNAAVLGAAVLMLAWHNIWMAQHGRQMAQESRDLGRSVAAGERPLYAVSIVIALAVLREGSEVVLFLYGIAASGAAGSGMLTGGLLGVAAGVAVSWLLYAGLLRIPLRHLFSVTGTMVTLLAAGMASQAVRFLIQMGAVPPLVDELWDTSAILRDDSLLGLTLKTLVGYTDRPAGMQLLAWLATVAAIIALTRLVRPAPARLPAE
ncbi:MAG: FTR1 family protein [Alphaproteobacteria bacterium]